MLKYIKANISTTKYDNVPTHYFDSIASNTLGIITLPIKVGLVILDTLIHVMHETLNYNLLMEIS